MIHVPIVAWAHTVVDLTAWISGLVSCVALYHWSLKAPFLAASDLIG